MKLLATKLNSTYKTLQKQSKKSTLQADFWSGDLSIALPVIAKKVVPFSKVALLYSKEGYEVFGKNLTEGLKKEGNSVISVVMPDSFSDNLQDYSDIFNLGEDVRIIVALDKKFYSVCKYFASLRGIDCVLAVTNLNGFGLLSPEISLRNQDILEKISLSTKCHILLDYNQIKKGKDSLPNAHAFTVSHSLALVDYRVNALMTGGSIDKAVYELASSSIVKAYSLFANKKEDFFSVVTENLFNLELANLFTENKLYNSFSSNIVSKLGEGNYAGNLLLASTLIAKIYGLFCSEKYTKLLKTPNYLDRVDYISKLLEVNHAEITKRLNENYKVIEHNRSKGGQALKKMKKDVDSFIKCSGVMLNTFTALGGVLSKKSEKISKVIKHSGDLVVNGMTFVRESGITEFI